MKTKLLQVQSRKTQSLYPTFKEWKLRQQITQQEEREPGLYPTFKEWKLWRSERTE